MNSAAPSSLAPSPPPPAPARPEAAAPPSSPISQESATAIGPVLGDLRRRLGMDVALVSRFEDGRRVIEVLDTDEDVPFAPGDSDPFEATYCALIVDGHLPETIPDTSRDPVAVTLAATHELDIAAHLGVPVVLDDGTVYGTLCAYSHEPRPDLGEQAGTVMGLVADTVARAIAADHQAQQARDEATARAGRLVVRQRLDMAYQPVVELASGRTVGLEALARFPDSPGAGPAVLFAEAAAAGVGPELELACVRAVRDQVDGLPAELDLHLNLSPAALLHPAADALLRELPLHRIVLDLSEHQIVGPYESLQAALAPLRAAGLRVAVDDAGAGLASMRHALLLQPDLLKLDITLVRGIDADPAKRSLCQALTGLAHAIGARILAEGVETQAESETLRSLRVDLAQGYHFAPPGPPDAPPPAPAVAAPAEVDQAAQVQAVVDDLRGHASAHTIAAALNARALLAPTGRRWHATSVSRQLLQ